MDAYVPRIRAFWAANSSSVKIPWFLRAASCVNCSTGSGAAGGGGAGCAYCGGGCCAYCWSSCWDQRLACRRDTRFDTLDNTSHDSANFVFVFSQYNFALSLTQTLEYDLLGSLCSNAAKTGNFVHFLDLVSKAERL